jgi:Right handed beta helix region
MRFHLLLLLGSCLTVLNGPQAQCATTSENPAFFVATNGNDAWSGRLAEPNRQGTDGPFATVARALKANRENRSRTSKAPERTAILIRQGVYLLNEPVVFAPEDSGLLLSAYRSEKPTFSGGRKINGWKEVEFSGKKLWATDIPNIREGKWFFRELWINGRRAVRARHPNHGYLSVAELLDSNPDWTKGLTRFRFREGDLRAWPAATNAEVIVFNRWVESRLPIASVDEKQRTVTFGKRSVFQLAPGDLYYVEHTPDILDEAGEWYLDRKAGRIYYQPQPGDKIDHIEAVAPVLSQVVRIEGNPEAKQFVERIEFKGLTFSHTEWCFPEGFQSAKNKPQISPEPQAEVGGFAQAAIGVPATVWGEGVHQCVFDNCTFSNLGNYGLELARGCVSNRIVSCEFADLGAGGLKIGETAIRQNKTEQSGFNEIADCNIHDGGKIFASAIGVWIGQSPNNRITHSLIHDFFYTGISIGWTWGYGPSLATNNLVAFNHVHHIGVKSDGDGPVLSDMGGIYTLGKQPGTRILNNLWHDIAGIQYGGWGIYFDEGSSGILAASNVVYRTTHGGFHQHYGETNLVRNNVFAFGRDQQLQRSREEPHRSFSFETNIVYFDSGTLMASEWSGTNFLIDWNIYFDARPNAKEMTFANAPLGKWREQGKDRNSILADPLFVSPKEYDFQLRSNSPALKIGFEPIDLSRAGFKSERAR